MRRPEELVNYLPMPLPSTARLPTFSSHYYVRGLPPEIGGEKRDKHPNVVFNKYPITAALYQHFGRPLTLSPTDRLCHGEYYLSLSLRPTIPASMRDSLVGLAGFLNNNLDVSWLVAASWLASIRGGQLVERFGFSVARSIELPLSTVQGSKDTGRLYSEPSGRYLYRIERALVHFIYARADEYCRRWYSQT